MSMNMTPPAEVVRVPHEHAGRCGIFATLQNSFQAATVRDKFSNPMSRIYYSSGGVS